MSDPYARAVIEINQIRTGYRGTGENYHRVRKLYRMRLICGHIKEKWCIRHVPSTTHCAECESVVTA